MAEAIEWVLRHHRLAKALYAAAEGNGRLSARLLRGEGRECPCCGGHFERMSQRRLAGFGGICPRCRSHPRHRAIALLLARGDLPGHRLLHFAPEPLFDPVFARLREIERTTADLYAPADLALDITKMDLADGSFDLILCSHVLEHVPDDRAAMSELRRVLAPGGLALVLTPYRPEVATYEDPAITAPLDRMVAFGQQDHVRIHGVDSPIASAMRGSRSRTGPPRSCSRTQWCAGPSSTPTSTSSSAAPPRPCDYWAALRRRKTTLR